MNKELEKTLSRLEMLSKSPNWEEREGGGFGLRDLLAEQFETIYPICLKWAKSKDPNIRRAVVLSCRQLKGTATPEKIKKVLCLAEVLLSDREVYVRKNLGPYAIGHLFYYFPEAVTPFLKKWMRNPDEQVRWNVAMTFQQAAGRKHHRIAVPILADLIKDERRFVWRACISSLVNIGRNDISYIKPAIDVLTKDSNQGKLKELIKKIPIERGKKGK